MYNNIKTVFPPDIKLGKFEDTNLLLWNFNSVSRFCNFGYPFSVDGHIFKKDLLVKLLTYDFDTPNSLEGRFNRDWLEKSNMCSFKESVLVNNPINLVGSSNNNAGKFHGQTLEELNSKFLENHLVSLNDIMSEKIYACHQEMEIEFI